MTTMTTTITKSLVMASLILLIAANAYAVPALPGNYTHNAGTKFFDTVTVNTKAKAYSIGFQKLQALKHLKSGKELSEMIGVNVRSLKEKESVTLQPGGYVTVQELMNENGDIVYRGRVNITYHFSSRVESD
ncbi:MAG: DUF3316 domain-containing protein [Psychromonas sp.]|nr:DUF3316 domain-containing protein [Psychromonas sp.]